MGYAENRRQSSGEISSSKEEQEEDVSLYIALILLWLLRLCSPLLWEMKTGIFFFNPFHLPFLA